MLDEIVWSCQCLARPFFFFFRSQGRRSRGRGRYVQTAARSGTTKGTALLMIDGFACCCHVKSAQASHSILTLICQPCPACEEKVYTSTNIRLQSCRAPSNQLY